MKGTHANINVERATDTGISFSISQIFHSYNISNIQARDIHRPFAFMGKLGNPRFISAAYGPPVASSVVTWFRTCSTFIASGKGSDLETVECQTDQELLEHEPAIFGRVFHASSLQGGENPHRETMVFSDLLPLT